MLIFIIYNVNIFTLFLVLTEYFMRCIYGRVPHIIWNRWNPSFNSSPIIVLKFYVLYILTKQYFLKKINSITEVSDLLREHLKCRWRLIKFYYWEIPLSDPLFVTVLNFQEMFCRFYSYTIRHYYIRIEFDFWQKYSEGRRTGSDT